MTCPICGEKLLNGKSICLRCGYQCKSLVFTSSNENDKIDENNTEDKTENEYREINPDDVRMNNERTSHGFGEGSIFDQLFGGGIFGGSRGGGGLFSSLFGDIFGSVFGDEYENDAEIRYSSYDGENHYTDEFGRPVPIDVFDRDFVEVEEVECFDENGNIIEKSNRKHKKKNKDRKENK